jgi:signal transduction histidine kinase
MTMWTPDIRTIFLMIFLINASLALMICAFWKTQKTFNGFALWAASLLFQSLAYLLFMLRGEISDLLSIPVANVLCVLAMIMRIDAIRRFILSKPVPVWYYSLLIPVFMTFYFYTYIVDSIVFRAFISTLLIASCLFIAAILAFISRERENRFIRYLFAATLSVPAFWMIIRLAAWVGIPEQYTLFSTDVFNTTFFIVAIITDILATGFFLILHMVRSQNALRLTNEKLSLLSSITRHDIVNQLHALTSYLELSRLSLADPTRLSDLITKEKRIAGTIEHQIGFTRDYEEMGVTAPAWQNVEGIVRLAALALPLRNIRIEVDRTDLEIFADRLLAKVFYNLLDNALRYGGDTMTRIRISGRETENGLILVFEDDGAGISPRDKKRLFTRGYGKNTGLGLFLSREILSITGITITENGEPNKGARFELLIPDGYYRYVRTFKTKV